jgi:DNA-binding transcriptional MerR regulator/effector-binding domain-containing protein
MYTIGEFAAYGHVSARMLRHYDAIGLLTPADVDEHSGYRRYAPEQLGELMRIVELRDFGCSLDDAAEVLGAADADAALRALLERRRAELAASLSQDATRLMRLETRLSALRGEAIMAEIEYKSIAPVTVYAASGVAPGSGPENVSPVVDQILPPLLNALKASGVEFQEPGIFWYEPVEGTDDLRVWVSWTAGAEPVAGDGWEVVELPAVERAASLTYHGAMPGIGQAWHQLMQGASDDGGVFSGPGREVYIYSDGPQEDWITELQQPVQPVS